MIDNFLPQVREATIADAGAIAKVLVHTFLVAHKGQVPDEIWLWRERVWTPEFVTPIWERTLSEMANGVRPHDSAFVAETASGEIVGIAKGESGEVTALYVHPDHQGGGIGKRLLAAVAAHQAQRGMTALQVGTLVTNTPARRFYESAGGQFFAERDIEDGGHPLREVIYHWSDISAIRLPDGASI